MFTGIIEELGRIASLRQLEQGMRLAVECGLVLSDLKESDSIAVNGVCLTAIDITGNSFSADVSPETIERTTLGRLAPGSPVNLERAVTPSTRLGGHIVQGHVDGVGTIERVEANPEDWRLTIRPPAGFMEWVAPKGSVTIEGVSLTIADVNVQRATFGVALIPTTLELTTLGALREGSRVNLEGDVIAKTVVHWLKHYGR